MLKSLTATALIAIAACPGAFADTKNLDIDGFDTIEAKGAMHVVYSAGPVHSVRIETDGSDFSDADISVDGDTLVITRESLSKRGFFGGANLNVSDDGKTIRVNGKKVPYYLVRVTSPDLKSFKIAQSSTGSATGLAANNFAAQASSSANLTLSGKATRAEIDASSSGEINATDLEAGSLDITVSSSAEIDAKVTGTEKTEISASSSGEVTLQSAQKASFEVSASSAGDVALSGACESAEFSASSAADIDARELECTAVTASASSGANIDAFASGAADGNASSGGDVTFAGSPATREVRESSGGGVAFN